MFLNGTRFQYHKSRNPVIKRAVPYNQINLSEFIHKGYKTGTFLVLVKTKLFYVTNILLDIDLSKLFTYTLNTS